MSKGHDLSHIRYQGKAYHGTTRVAIVVSKWNETITEALFEGASAVLRAAGLPSGNILRYDVPGSFELPLGARIALKKQPDIHGVIALGCIIQGETRHFDFIAQAVADGLMRLNLDSGKPVIFGVLTPDNDQQAADRAGGKFGNKGEEAAVAFLDMVDLIK
ncbi:MAG: 6,7-dimethyl-8-ribityllumazine synthase [Bacteroidia bacterium]